MIELNNFICIPSYLFDITRRNSVWKLYKQIELKFWEKKSSILLSCAMTMNQIGGLPSALYPMLSVYWYVKKPSALQRRMQPKFGVEEKVLCYHGPLLYEAKILKMKKEGGVFTYFVHYQVRHANFII